VKVDIVLESSDQMIEFSRFLLHSCGGFFVMHTGVR
jgi:hypothetical protein